MKFDKEIERLHKKKMELMKELGRTEADISKYIANCKHKIIKQGSIVSIALCEKCGKHFGWWCPKSKNHICEYPNSNYNGEIEYCVYCHQPEERK